MKEGAIMKTSLLRHLNSIIPAKLSPVKSFRGDICPIGGGGGLRTHKPWGLKPVHMPILVRRYIYIW